MSGDPEQEYFTEGIIPTGVKSDSFEVFKPAPI